MGNRLAASCPHRHVESEFTPLDPEYDPRIANWPFIYPPSSDDDSGVPRSSDAGSSPRYHDGGLISGSSDGDSLDVIDQREIHIRNICEAANVLTSYRLLPPSIGDRAIILNIAEFMVSASPPVRATRPIEWSEYERSGWLLEEP